VRDGIVRHLKRAQRRIGGKAIESHYLAVTAAVEGGDV
jgi:hypothetical protein